MKILLLISLTGAVYSYVLYPLLLLCIPRRNRIQTSRRSDHLPSIDLIITAHNEARSIGAKLDNALSLDYPADKLKITVASDGSTDDTNRIVDGYKDRGVALVNVTDHKGKEHAQLCAIQATDNEIVVFSDVATIMEAHSLREIASLFSNSQMGAVSSEDRFFSESGEIAGEGLYVRYEMWLRGLESERAGLVGLSGSLFAARRIVCDDWDTQSPSDFNTALQCKSNGLVAVSDSGIRGFYKDLADPQREYARKVRTVLRGITALIRHSKFLNLKKYGLFAFQLWSHKVMRWMVPWFLVGIAVTSISLSKESQFGLLVCVGQIMFYSIAALGWRSKRMREFPLVRVVFFFTQVNFAVAHASIRYLLGSRITTWSPSRR